MPAKDDALAKAQPKFSVVTLGVVVLAVGVLCGLGVWQVKRLQWKTELLHRIQALQYAPAEPLNVALNHLEAGRDVDFIRVTTACEPAPPAPPARVYTVSDAGPGWRPIVLCRLKVGPYSAVLLDLGIEPDAARATDGPLTAPAQLTGVLRIPPGHRPFMATPDGEAGEFGWRNVKAISAYLGAPGAAPVFLMLEKPAAAQGIQPQPAPVDIPNNHLGYALTWFGLAAALVGVYIAALLKRRRTSS